MRLTIRPRLFRCTVMCVFRCTVMCTLAFAALTAALARPAAADEPPSIVHPIYAAMPEAPLNDVAQRELARAAARYHLRGVEVVDIEAPPPPQTGAAIEAGMDLVEK